MSIDQSVTLWIEELRAGEEEAAKYLWQRYFQRLVRLASRKLPGDARRDFDEEDIALSAFHSLCQGVAKGRFPDLNDRNNLWSLLVVITARKVMHCLRDRQAQKRGGDQVRGESVFLDAEGDQKGAGIGQVIGKEPTPEFAAEVAEESQRLLDELPDELMRELALLKMEGHTNEEAAQQLGCSLRTVERRLELIRKLWVVQSEDSAVD